jgi:hypothetical protein
MVNPNIQKTGKLTFLSIFLLALLVIVSCGRKQDPVVNQTTDTTKQAPDKNINQPSLEAGYMYWMPPAILDTHWRAAVTGTVEVIDKNTKPATDPAKEEVFGLVKIDRILYSEPVGEKNIEKEKFIRTDALKGFKPGDKIIIFFTDYKNAYAIKRGNVLKISGDGDELVGLAERFIKNSQNTEYIMKDPAEYKLWGKYDVGTASRLMQEYEMKTNGK